MLIVLHWYIHKLDHLLFAVYLNCYQLLYKSKGQENQDELNWSMYNKRVSTDELCNDGPALFGYSNAFWFDEKI